MDAKCCQYVLGRRYIYILTEASVQSTLSFDLIAREET